jgi:hypothetical protein
VSVTRNPTWPTVTTAKPIPRTIGRTSDRRGLGATPVDVAATGSFAGGSQGGWSGGGRACRQVGYGFCPANRTRPSYSLCAARCLEPRKAEAAISPVNTNSLRSSIQLRSRSQRRERGPTLARLYSDLEDRREPFGHGARDLGHQEAMAVWRPFLTRAEDFANSACRTRRERLGFVRDLF